MDKLDLRRQSVSYIEKCAQAGALTDALKADIALGWRQLGDEFAASGDATNADVCYQQETRWLGMTIGDGQHD